jgi:tetratricopeptide (TPR) repeat protein/tRNA A-37 threonylcarbamoyl transferase component Bud32
MNGPHNPPDGTAPYLPQPVAGAEDTADPTTVARAGTTHPDATASAWSIGDVPGYEVTSEIARGGMGAVLAARDQTLDREVAIKVILEGKDRDGAGARFVREARITARLPHPGVPPVHALGTLANGAPFLVMKLIRGTTLAALLARRPSPHHDLPRSVQVFEQIAQAVGFAHARGIIHRDLKPANVMVGEFGEVQVMDWGLAKFGTRNPERGIEESDLNSEFRVPDSAFEGTVAGAVMGTPSFMAPEQARGAAVDQRADVFALGAILCVVLTGQPPFPGGKSAVETVRRAAAGDLTEVFAKLDACGADAELVALAKRCLAPAAGDRFADAKEVADAVARYRDGVEARVRQAESERSAAAAREAEQRKRRRVVRRATGLVVAVLVLGIAGTTVGMVRAGRARDAEVEQKKQALAARDAATSANEHTRQTQAILLGVFTDLDLRKVRADTDPLEQVLARRLVRAAGQLDALAADDPLGVAALQANLSASLSGLGFPREALPTARKAHEAQLARFGPDHPDTLASLDNVAVCYYLDGKYDVARPLYEDVVARRKVALGPDHPDTLRSMSNLADCYRALGRIDLALPLLQETLARRTAALGANHADTLTSLNNLAALYLLRADFLRALAMFEDCLKRRRDALGPDHIDTRTSLGNLAHALQAADKLDAALPLLEETVTLMTKRLGPDHPSTLTALSNLGLGYHAAKQFDKSVPLMEETLRLSKTRLGPDHPDTLVNMNNLASGYQARGRIDLAVPLFEEALKFEKIKLGENHPTTLLTMNNLALGYQALKKYDLAVPLLEEGLRRLREKSGDNHPDTVALKSNLGQAYRATGTSDRALPLLEEVLAYRRGNQGAGHPLTLGSLTSLAEAYAESGQGAKAVPLFDEFLDHHRRQLKPNDPFLAGFLLQIAQVFVRTNQHAAVEKYLREALAILEKLAPTNWATADTKSQLGGALLAQKKLAEARPLLLAGYEGLRKAPAKPKQASVTLAAALDRLIRLAEAEEKPEEAKRWREEKGRVLGKE